MMDSKNRVYIMKKSPSQDGLEQPYRPLRGRTALDSQIFEFSQSNPTPAPTLTFEDVCEDVEYDGKLTLANTPSLADIQDIRHPLSISSVGMSGTDNGHDARQSLVVPMADQGGRPYSVSSSLYSASVFGSATSSTVSILKNGSSSTRKYVPSCDSLTVTVPRSPSSRSNWSELARLVDSHDTMEMDEEVHTDPEQENVSTKTLSQLSSRVTYRMTNLAERFRERTRVVKQVSITSRVSFDMSMEETSATVLEDGRKTAVEEQKLKQKILKRMAEAKSMEAISSSIQREESEEGEDSMVFPRWYMYLFYRVREAIDAYGYTLRSYRKPINPYTDRYVFWMGIVSCAFIYNAVVIFLRSTFPYQTKENLHYWLIADYFCDFIYISDVVLVKPRVSFYRNGVLVVDKTEIKKEYLGTKQFRIDVLALAPLDILYFFVGVVPILRLPRLLKLPIFYLLMDRIDQKAKTLGYTVRVVKTVLQMLYLIHIKACGFYAISYYEGIGSNPWVYDGTGNAYIKCFYLATLTSASIGEVRKVPTNSLEFAFMSVYWIVGVMIFAVLVGQMRFIFSTASKRKQEHLRRLDSIMRYMESYNVPQDLRNKVRHWFLFNWEQTESLDEYTLIEPLPLKMRTDVAISVHYKTLSKVKLFQDCDHRLLFDLVLKLKKLTCLPGDCICRKGEIGREMYILMDGIATVVGDEGNVLVELTQGSVFGEISLLGLEGCQRRTATVLSKGYSQLFTLSKDDFQDAMNNYGEVKKILHKKARQLLNKDHKREHQEIEEVMKEDIIKLPEDTLRNDSQKSNKTDSAKSSSTGPRKTNRISTSLSKSLKSSYSRLVAYSATITTTSSSTGKSQSSSSTSKKTSETLSSDTKSQRKETRVSDATPYSIESMSLPAISSVCTERIGSSIME